MFGEFFFIISDPLSSLQKSLPNTNKEQPESNEYNWSTEFEGI